MSDMVRLPWHSEEEITDCPFQRKEVAVHQSMDDLEGHRMAVGMKVR